MSIEIRLVDGATYERVFTPSVVRQLHAFLNVKSTWDALATGLARWAVDDELGAYLKKFHLNDRLDARHAYAYVRGGECAVIVGTWENDGPFTLAMVSPGLVGREAEIKSWVLDVLKLGGRSLSIDGRTYYFPVAKPFFTN